MLINTYEFKEVEGHKWHLFDTDTGLKYEFLLYQQITDREDWVRRVKITKIESGGNPDMYISYMGEEAIEFWSKLSGLAGFPGKCLDERGRDALKDWFAKSIKEIENSK